MLGNALYNIALAMDSINLRKSFNLLNEAEKYSPSDKEIINQKIRASLHPSSKTQLSDNTLTKYSNQVELKNTILMSNLIAGNNVDINASDVQDDRGITSSLLKLMVDKNTDEAKILKFIQEQKHQLHLVIEWISKILITNYINIGLYHEGLSLISKLKSEYPEVFKYHKNPYLKYIEFIIYEANDLTEEGNEIIDYFKAIYKFSDRLHYQYTEVLRSRAENILTKQGEEEAKKFISQVDDKNIAKMLFKYTSNLQKAKQQEAKQITSQEELFVNNSNTSDVKNSSDSSESEVTELSVLIVSQEDEDITTTEVTVDHKQIHQHYQQLKTKVLPISQPILPAKFGSYWLVNDKKYYTYQEDVYQLELNKYGYIDQGKFGKIDSKIQGQFVQAIKKGKIGHFTNTTGVICFNNESVAKIKINGDCRLYTSKQYENEEGKKLLIFDRIGNHNELDRVSHHGVMKTEYVEGYTCDNTFTEANDTGCDIDLVGLTV
ncbi:MAG: hypothetical protein EOP33_00870 [Rickettsiaceae bacterium]|nr:MAG: hypothetical protein EOP33_00870 [Rickettsiaceae bacterium]